MWYGTNPDLPDLAAQIERGAMVWTVRDGMLGHQRGRHWRGVVPVGALARPAQASPHDLSNALGAAALAHALGMPERAIVAGLPAGETSQEKGRIRA